MQKKSEIFIRRIERLDNTTNGNPMYRIIAGLADDDGIVTDAEFRTWPNAGCAYEISLGHGRWKPSSVGMRITWEQTPKGKFITRFSHN